MKQVEMLLIKCKVELKLRLTKCCVLAVTANDIYNGNPNRIIFTTKDKKFYDPVVTLSTKNKQKLSKILCKGFERSIYWNKYKTKSHNKNAKNEHRILDSNFEGVNRLFVLVHPNQDDSAKRINAKKYYLPKNIIKNYNVISNGMEWKLLQPNK